MTSGTGRTTPDAAADPGITVFLYTVSQDVSGRMDVFGRVSVPSTSTNPERDGWLQYVRRNGTPPVGEYLVFAKGHRYSVAITETPSVNDLGVPT